MEDAERRASVISRRVRSVEAVQSVKRDAQQEQYTPEGRPMHPLPPEAKPVSELFAS